MKYIVLYIITILWITSSETAAQKPALDLLPSTNGHIHPEAMIDTSSTNDSLVLIVPSHPGASTPAILSEEDNIRKNERRKGTGLDSLFKRRNSRKVQESMKPGINPLIFRNINPIRFLFHMTALNI